MKKVAKTIAALMLMTAVVFAEGCKPEGNNDSEVHVTTYTPQYVTRTSAVCGGDVIVTKGLSLSALGVCWSTDCNPTVEDAHLSTMNWSEPYVCTITGLVPDTKYHVRAYVLRGLEYYYGDDKSFTTEGNSGGGGVSVDGHEWVDLGLPSGLIWATCNVGANAPQEYGDYFAWGETQPKSVYNLDTYQYYDGSNLTKYTGSDGLTTLLPADDAAAANWGNSWRMPTEEEWRELYNNTTVTRTQQGGVNGCLFTAANGNSLFLPAAGICWDDELQLAGYWGGYWLSSLIMDIPYRAWGFFFEPDYYCEMSSPYRDHGQSVRAVRFGL